MPQHTEEKLNCELMTAAVSQILRLAEVSPKSNFVDLGGSSLEAVRLAARLERETGVRIDPQEVLGAETLTHLSLLLASRAETTGAKATATEPGGSGVRQRARASMAQQWALDAERLEPDAPPLQFQAAYTVNGPLDLSLLQGALRTVAAHHPALQVRFARNADYDEMIGTSTDPMMVIEDGSVDRHARVARLTEYARQPFPADASCRLRMMVLRAGPALHDLCLAFDHRTADGWSLNVVLEDVSTAYGQLLAGEPVQLLPAGSYLDYAETEWDGQERRVLRAADYWRGVLPGDYSQFAQAIPGRQESNCLEQPRAFSMMVPETAVSRILSVTRATGASALSVAMAALARVIAALSGDDDVRILTSSANRNHTGHDRTVGWFANGIFPTFHVSEYRNEVDLVRHIGERLSHAAKVSDVPAAYVRNALWHDAPGGFRKDTGIYLACNQSWSEPLVLRGCTVTPIEIEDRADAPGIQLFLNRERSGWFLRTYFHETEYPADVVRKMISLFIDRLSTAGS